MEAIERGNALDVQTGVISHFGNRGRTRNNVSQFDRIPSGGIT